MIASRYSADQSSSAAGVTRGSAARTAASPRTAQPASSSIPISGPRCVAAHARSTSSVSAAPQTPVRRILALSTMRFAISSSAARMDIDVADAFEMREDRHPRLRLHARDEALAAARHDDVEVAVEPGEHRADGGAVAGRHELDRMRPAGRRAARPSTMAATIAAAERKLSEPARRIAALPALRQSAPASAVDVGAALEDHPDDAERRRDALDRRARSGARTSRARARPGRAARRCPRPPPRSPRGGPRRGRDDRGKPASAQPPSRRRHHPHWRRELPPRRRGSRPPWREAPRSSRSAPASESRRAAARASPAELGHDAGDIRHRLGVRRVELVGEAHDAGLSGVHETGPGASYREAVFSTGCAPKGNAAVAGGPAAGARPVEPARGPHRHLGMALRQLVGAVLPRRPAQEGRARLLRDPLRRGGAQRPVLPHADAGGGAGLVRPDAGRFPLRLEGIEIHHPLEAALRALRQLARADGEPPRAPAAQGRPDPVPAAAEDARQPGAARRLPQDAEPGPALHLRVPPSELVRGPDLRSPAPARRRALPLGPCRRAGALGSHGELRLHPRPRPDRALPRQLHGRDAARLGRRHSPLAKPRPRGVVLLRQRRQERRAARRAAAVAILADDRACRFEVRLSRPLPRAAASGRGRRGGSSRRGRDSRGYPRSRGSPGR